MNLTLIILDLSMPDYDGFTFLKFRNGKKALSAIPVIVLSGTKKPQDIQRALELGADQFIVKPFESRIILQKLRFIFYSKENYVYRFEQSEQIEVDAEIVGEIVEQGLGRLKVSSQVRFCDGKSVEVHSLDYLANEGAVVVCKVEKHLVELEDGFFRTALSVSGLGTEEKKHFEKWQRSL